MQSYAIAPAIFWGIVLLMAILSFLSFGHELWRRIFPLSFLSQLPQHLGIQRRVRQFNPITEGFRMPTNWMGSSGQGFMWGVRRDSQNFSGTDDSRWVYGLWVLGGAIAGASLWPMAASEALHCQS